MQLIGPGSLNQWHLTKPRSILERRNNQRLTPNLIPNQKPHSIGVEEINKMRATWKASAVALAVAAIVFKRTFMNQGHDGDGDSGWNSWMMQWLKQMSDRLGIWAIPAYVAMHTLTLALCLPYAVFFEAGASMLFGFLQALICVFSAKVLGASLSFGIGRLLFKSSGSASQWVQNNKYFHILSRGVERDGWKFVLLARFSPIPSYVINYALAATNVSFLIDFLLPTVIGCLPMILQNTSLGSLAKAAAASASGKQKSHIWSYLFPILGILSSVLISLRIKKYSSDIASGDDFSVGVTEAPSSSGNAVSSKRRKLSDGKRK